MIDQQSLIRIEALTPDRAAKSKNASDEKEFPFRG
jgi:hypothetical protein